MKQVQNYFFGRKTSFLKKPEKCSLCHTHLIYRTSLNKTCKNTSISIFFCLAIYHIFFQRKARCFLAFFYIQNDVCFHDFFSILPIIFTIGHFHHLNACVSFNHPPALPFLRFQVAWQWLFSGNGLMSWY